MQVLCQLIRADQIAEVHDLGANFHICILRQKRRLALEFRRTQNTVAWLVRKTAMNITEVL